MGTGISGARRKRIRQPPEDMRGRPTGPRHEENPRSGRETPGTHTSLDDIPDGEGVASDKGETPVPETTRRQPPLVKPDVVSHA